MPVLMHRRQVLKAAGHPGYGDFSSRSSAQLGAVGGAVTAPAWVIFFLFLATVLRTPSPLPTEDPEAQKAAKSPVNMVKNILKGVVGFFVAPAMGASFGAVGSAILIKHNKNVLSVLAATRSGAVGGAILGPGVGLFYTVIALAGVGCLQLFMRKNADAEAEAEEKEKKEDSD